MSKKVIVKTNKNLEPVEKNIQNISPNPEFYYKATQNALRYFTSENAPKDYNELKKEVKFLESIHAQSFVILAHRLKIIRDNELYKKDGYSNFKNFIDNELDLAKRMVYNYIFVFEVFGVHPGALINQKITSLVRIASFVKEYPEDRENLLEKARNLSRRDLEKYLKSTYLSNKRSEENGIKEDFSDFYDREEDLIKNSTFIRAGMKIKTVKAVLKDIANWFFIHDPKNKKIKKLIQEMRDL